MLSHALKTKDTKMALYRLGFLIMTSVRLTSAIRRFERGLSGNDIAFPSDPVSYERIPSGGAYSRTLDRQFGRQGLDIFEFCREGLYRIGVSHFGIQTETAIQAEIA